MRKSLNERLAILSGAAKYDASCASSGTSNRNSAKSGGLGWNRVANVASIGIPIWGKFAIAAGGSTAKWAWSGRGRSIHPICCVFRAKGASTRRRPASVTTWQACAA
ncbi:hypothetical protein CPY51_12755 [Rhizobium tubonense]|uniref:Uncharacterized protein n=1 Tax=Rhizobium tubonense TaxID=484088 RepID=A0A2W4D9A4_9HYPH|nr:hypothetical protein CPY51_12755 [Rhizobium tubonense]